MPIRTRKLIGGIALIVLAAGWPFLAAAFLQVHIAAMPATAQIIAYAVLGLVWVIPAGWLVRWMQQPDRE